MDDYGEDVGWDEAAVGWDFLFSEGLINMSYFTTW